MSDDPAMGMVALVGGGPGDPQLITLAGAVWLSNADTVVYDRLISPALLAMAPPQADLVYVGKGRAGNVMSQEQINAVLIERARAGQRVVRLKGGDPFTFGRGGEEALALAEAGVPYRIVPGVTAAAGATAYAGIPLTDRRLASSVALVTGQEDSTREGTRINYAALAGIDTVVFYMGVENLPEIAGRLLAAGKPASTPAALIERGTTGRQRTVVGTLETIAGEAQRQNVRPPALIVVGEVVAFHDQLAWRPPLPLARRTVLVTRSREQASQLSASLGELGADAIEAPTISIQPPESWTAVDAAIGQLDQYRVLCFTSPNGVDFFCGRAMARGVDARALAGLRIAAVGPATAEMLRLRFLRADVVPGVFTTEAMAEAILALGDLAGQRVLLARADIARPQLADALRAGGAKVDEVTLYRTVRPDSLPPPAQEALREGRVDWITFTSSSTVKNFLALAQPLADEAGGWPALLGLTRLASIGPVTSATLRSHGLEPFVQAQRHDVAGLVEAILQAEQASPREGGPA